MTIRRAAILALAGFVALVVGTFAWERAALWSARGQVRFGTTKPDPWRAYAVKPVIRPPVVRGIESELAPETPVIGVEIDGKARAYRVEAMADRHHHVVNDLVGNVPITVAYCDLTDCVQVYVDPSASAPLDVSLAGLLAGAMVIQVEGALYDHQTGRAVDPAKGPATIRFERLAPIRTTWREWLAQHPETDVYVGDRPTGLRVPLALPVSESLPGTGIASGTRENAEPAKSESDSRPVPQ